MSDASVTPEPSMDEILQKIQRIIAEDEKPESAPAAETARVIPFPRRYRYTALAAAVVAACALFGVGYLGLPLGTVKTRTRAALGRLAGELEDELG